MIGGNCGHTKRSEDSLLPRRVKTHSRNVQMLRRVANRAMRMVRSEENTSTQNGAGHAAPAAHPPLQFSNRPSDSLSDLDGIAAAVAKLAQGQAPAVSTDRVALTSGATNDSAIQDVLNLSEDGEQYWGPIDNDSARSKANGEVLIIDQWECIQCGTCVENTDAVFALPDDCKASVFNQDGPMDLVQDAIDACPVTCIHWTGEPESFEQLNDHVGQALD